MIGKLVRAGALALAALSLVSNASASTLVAEIYIAHPHVRQVICDDGKGTAFQIASGLFLSVNHVTRNEGCTIDGKPLVLLYADAGEDFSILQHKSGLKGGIKVNCDGYQDGQFYHSIGYAGGLPVQRVITIRASDSATAYRGGGRFYVLYGPETVIPGMSGGPILNGAGEVVGVTNAYHPYELTSFSRELKRTPLCR